MDKEFKKMLWQNSKFLLGSMAVSALSIGILFGLTWLFTPLIGEWPGYAVSAIIFLVVVVLLMSYLEWRYKQKAAKQAAKEKARREFLYNQDQEGSKTESLSPREVNTEGMEQILKDIRRIINKKD